MNGRVYDYNLGRFLSIDPLIQAPGNSQSLNPYSYIMNNPLAGTDPSGYASVGNLGLGEWQHCNFHCMIGYHGFTVAGSNGADVKATVEIVTLGIDKNAAEIGARIFTDTEAGIAYLGNSVTNYHSSAIRGEAYLDSRIIGAVTGMTKFIAYIHTHSRATPGSDEFSDLSATRTCNGSGGDLPMAAYWAKTLMLQPPQGSLHKFTYSKWKDGTPIGVRKQYLP